MLVPIFTGVITLLELSEKFSQLAIGQKTFDQNLRGKDVKAKNGFINWFYSSFATTDTKQNVGTATLGKLTGFVYRSRINSNLYYEVALSRNIGNGFDNEAIWVNFNDLEFSTQQSNNNNNTWIILGLILWLLSENK